LLLLVVVSVLPLFAFGLGHQYFEYRDDVAATGRETLARARSLSLLVEQRLQTYVDALGVISGSSSLQDGDFGRFRDRAIGILQQQFPGAGFVVLRADGRQIINTRLPPGAPPPIRASMETTREVFETGRPMVSNLFDAASDRRPIVAIDVPVKDSAGKVIYVVSANPNLADFAALLQQQLLSPNWVASVFDGRGVNIARIPNGDRFVGHKAAPSFLATLLSQREGILDTTSLEGTPLLTAFTRSERFGWSIGIGVPRAELTGPALASAMNTLAAGAALLAVGLALALYASRRIAAPIESLRRLATAGADPLSGPALTGLPETDEVARALLAAEHDRQRSQRAETMLRDGIKTMREGFAVYDEQDRLVFCNDSYRQLFPACPERVVVGTAFAEMLGDGSTADRDVAALAERVSRHRNFRGTIEQRLPDGRWALVSSQQLPNGSVAVMRIDITALKAAQQALGSSEERFRLVVESVPNAIIMIGADGHIEMVNAQAERVFGYHRAELLDQPIEMLVPARHRGHHPGLRSSFFANPEARTMGVGRDLFALRRDRSEFPVEIGLSPIMTDEGLKVLSSIIDITRRKEAERRLLDAQHRSEQTLAALSRSEEQLRRAQRLAHMGSFVTNLRTGEAEMSEETHRILGVRPGEYDTTLASFVERVHPDDRAFIANSRELGRQGICPEPAEFRIVRGDGSVRRISNESELILGDDGRPLYLAGTLHDVTERRQVEDQLRQSQKMEAIGNLTGGMAHDFNNLLGIIIGNLDYARTRIGQDDELVEVIGDAHSAAWHGADLTRRLLAFARRQPLRPEEIGINELVTNTVRLLGRLLGEDIDVSLDLAKETWRIVADPAQLEASLANLATNARDAMQKGGRLIIASSNRRLDADYAAAHLDAREGDYVLIEVSDTGTGMSPETISKIFEPFFTTKEPGKGTGLGLSMVFGFIRQSGGHISVYSEPGVGTTFRLYLPRATGEAAFRAAGYAGRVEQGVGETVLVVEDNSAVRRVVLRQLRDLGYRTLESGHAAEALDLLQRNRIDLLLTDIVMSGGLDGVELARMAIERWPKLKIVLTSGFPQTRIDSDAADLKCLRLLSKPYSREELAATLRATLDG
jgi:PAS domain S-box-containing protein